jgi:cryptochrome
VQRKAKCIIGTDYPAPMVDHNKVSKRNCQNMEELQDLLISKCSVQPDHVKPSGEKEVKQFFGFDN